MRPMRKGRELEYRAAAGRSATRPCSAPAPISQREVEQFETAARVPTEAQLRALDAQIREQRVELAYHRVTAPTGHRRRHSGPCRRPRDALTVLTTVDENAGLELYINVPVAQATGLEAGVDGPHRRRCRPRHGDQRIHSSRRRWIRPRSRCWSRRRSRARRRSARISSCARAWCGPARADRAAGLRGDPHQRSVLRLRRRERRARGGVARQRPVQLGAIVGNDYVVLERVEGGEQLIVSGVQKIGEGVPVKPVPPSAARAPAPHPQASAKCSAICSSAGRFWRRSARC